MMVKKATGKHVPEIDDAPPLDPRVAYLWDIYSQLHHTRNADTPITFTEIDAYCRVTKCDVQMWELDAIRELDKTWCKVKNDARSR